MHRQRRHLERQPNRTLAARLLEAIEALPPEHPFYAWWQALRQKIAIATEVG